MTEKKIDFETWERKDLFNHFSHTSSPFWSLTYEEDVTEVYTFAKANRISFYGAMIWTVSRALNDVKAFHYTIRKDGIYELEKRLPSFTNMKKDSELFQIITVNELDDDILSFCQKAQKLAETQEEFIRYEKESDALIFISTLPWVKVTGLTNEGMTDPDDAVPRVAWGRYEEKQGRKVLSVCFEVNHRLIDGYHIGQFHEAFRKRACALNQHTL